jgi:hypothetical protein
MHPPNRIAAAPTAGALLVLAACGGVGAPAPQPVILAYQVPDSIRVSYEFGDTASFTIETGAMGDMEVSTDRSGTAAIRFGAADQGVLAYVRFPRFHASFRNPAQGSVSADESAIGGSFTVAVAPRGTVEVVDSPSLDSLLLDIAGPMSLVRPFFVQLPGGPPEDRWVDTVTTVEEVGDTRTRTRTVVTSSLVGDTMVAGRRLLHIRTRAESSLEVTGSSGGMELEQRLDGVTTGIVLWDPVAGLLVERAESGDLEGTLELPGAGVPAFPVRGHLTRTVRLRR